MHFQQPELLYALILLVIPLIVHLFRLRKFQKEDFTNVKFLKKVIQETRKSSRLKKFLILMTRLLLLSCLILAFAKPFIPASDKAMEESRTLIYLDNSFSMQAGSEQASTLQKAVNQLMENLAGEGKHSLFTNSKDYFNRSAPEIKNEIQNITFTDDQIRYREIILKAKNYFKNFPNTRKNLVIISDFQQNLDIPSEFSGEIDHHLVRYKAGDIRNASVDTAYISNSTPESFLLNINLSSNRIAEAPVTLSIYDGEKLLGRNTVQFGDKKNAETSFRLQNNQVRKGRIEIEDNGLNYDNILYFNINEKTSVKVVIIANSETDFLNRIYRQPEFEIFEFQPDQIDFNQLNTANLVILNEIKQLPSSLINNLATVKENGSVIIIVPPANADGYTALLNRLGFPGFDRVVEQERLITKISFDHPLLENVFEDRIENFEYPKVLSSYNQNSMNSILEYQDGKAFLSESDRAYLFTAALNDQNSNFKNSPLIVPVFYQMGLKSLQANQLFYNTSWNSQIDIPVRLAKDEVLHLQKTDLNVIPQQKNFSNRVEMNTANLDLAAGNYEVNKDDETFTYLSFNYPRQESELKYADISNLQGSKIYDSVGEYFQKSNAATQITALWKWFVIFALIFLAIEMLLIKFFK
ncbi:vWA domain-containing protein [Christiangramia sabulilitoris]|uniref:Aerotolerance regulator N-terminal domain-containing protein n=1 Tax=Christiangramia sabulilitoris TaxID=2583991 RepID=A0A550I6J7_9FLAO|nr:BatA and WFA domain-containing protein [Christiangramia sabulilitoris]TRO66605.1 hypothetical protein FGM01_01605 [Christiangramia sabulilitoris]